MSTINYYSGPQQRRRYSVAVIAPAEGEAEGIDESILLSDKLTDIEKVLDKCTRKEIVPFPELFPDEMLLHSKKVLCSSCPSGFVETSVIDPPFHFRSARARTARCS